MKNIELLHKLRCCLQSIWSHIRLSFLHI